MLNILHLYESNTFIMTSFRQNLLCVLLLLGLSVLTSCGDDDNMMNVCPAPTDAFVLSTCLLDIPDELRPEDDPDVTFKVDLFKDNDTYYYAFLSSSISAPIEVYDACCNSICRIGPFVTEACDWRDTAEELGTIAEDL